MAWTKVKSSCGFCVVERMQDLELGQRIAFKVAVICPVGTVCAQQQQEWLGLSGVQASCKGFLRGGMVAEANTIRLLSAPPGGSVGLTSLVVHTSVLWL